MSVNYANRGQVFENLLDYTNQVYKNKGIALINKRPTPVRVLKTRGNRILSAVYDRKSTVDYDGVYKGHAIAFEAKSTKLKRLPLSIIADHQIRYLSLAKKHGSITFLIVNLRAIDKTFVLSSNLILDYVENARNGGRKSIPMGDIVSRGVEVTFGDGVPLDYIKAIDQMIG